MDEAFARQIVDKLARVETSLGEVRKDVDQLLDEMRRHHKEEGERITAVETWANRVRGGWKAWAWVLGVVGAALTTFVVAAGNWLAGLFVHK